MTTRSVTDSRLAGRGAASIAAAFDRFQADFDEVTARAAERFQQRDWQGAQRDAVERLEMYEKAVGRARGNVTDLLGERVGDKMMWAGIKAVYSGLIAERADWDLAETFLNSVTRRIFTTSGVDDRVEFVATDFAKPPTKPPRPAFHTFDGGGSVSALVEDILTDYRFEVLYADIRRDARLVAERIESHFRRYRPGGRIVSAEMVRTPFFRGQTAYLIGRLVCGGEFFPLVLALRNTGSSVVADAVLLDEDDVSVLFSFAYAYFRVRTDRPYELVRFLHTLMPRKRLSELYASIGYHKHAKTELYRELLDHLAASAERFEVAPGAPGLVMVTFTMPGYDLVFKVLRDVFGIPKQTTRSQVMDRYELVFKHDRAGRLIDARSFEHLEIHARHFRPELLEELTEGCGRTVELQGEQVIIHQVYVERRVTPLNLYVRSRPEQEALRAVLDYGQAIKDMAASNIFPGDLLTKNFGLTRHGRVVFYDYDELALVTDCEFRAMPPAADVDDEMSAEPWFGVGANDVFPEEFRSFLGLPAPLRERLLSAHPEIFDPAYWVEIQQRLQRGEVIEVRPYPDRVRIGSAPLMATG